MSTNPRTLKLRTAMAAHGLKRRELYAHDDDWPAIRDAADAARQLRLWAYDAQSQVDIKPIKWMPKS